jgi:hypothetical protein
MARPVVSPPRARIYYGVRRLNDNLLVSVTHSAVARLAEKYAEHRLYRFLTIGDGASLLWLVVPQQKVSVTLCGWSEEDKATIDAWLAGGERRAFMLPGHRARFRNPVVDCVDGKLVIRSGKKKITPLE